jgi:5-methylthioadenosine/S-adenosylhomocysteine deaminase
VLIKNAYVPGRGVTDIRAENGAITAIESTLDGSADLDATGLVAIPGFVDTHRHVVQSALRGVAPDMPLREYFTAILGRIAETYTEQDTRDSILLGAAEALNAGITTVFDWARTPVDLSINALGESGIRAVFASNDLDDEPTIRKNANRTGRITTAVAPVGMDFRSLEDTRRHLNLAHELGLVSSLHIGGAGPGGVKALYDEGLLRSDLHFVHGNRLTDDELKMIVDHGASLTVSTVVEALMGHGDTAWGRFRAAGGRPALGVDVVVNNPPDMFSEMQSTLWRERLKAPFPARELLASATIDGAKAVGLHDVGALEVGYRADIVLLDGLEHLVDTNADIEGAVVTTLSPTNVRTVLVDGEIVKRDGRLVHLDLATLRDATRGIAAKVLAG